MTRVRIDLNISLDGYTSTTVHALGEIRDLPGRGENLTDRQLSRLNTGLEAGDPGWEGPRRLAGLPAAAIGPREQQSAAEKKIAERRR